MVPADANFMGNVFGGTMLAEVDRAAYVTATRHAGAECVTASFDRVDFLAPVHIGDLVEFAATITFVGRSSMEVSVEVRAEAVRGGPRRTVGHAYVTMVAVDASGAPQRVPPLALTTDAERERFREGERRMVARRATRASAPPSRSTNIPRS